VFETRDQARLQVLDFIEGFYTPSARHSALGYLSPLRFEEQSLEQQEQSDKAAVV
jgi:putative transposase